MFSTFLLAFLLHLETYWSFFSSQINLSSSLLSSHIIIINQSPFDLPHPSRYDPTSLFFSSRNRLQIFSLIPLKTTFYLLTVDQNLWCWCLQCLHLFSSYFATTASPSASSHPLIIILLLRLGLPWGQTLSYLLLPLWLFTLSPYWAHFSLSIPQILIFICILVSNNNSHSIQTPWMI